MKGVPSLIFIVSVSLAMAQNLVANLSEIYDGCPHPCNINAAMALFSDGDNCIIIPNAFPPNNDGINDVFNIPVNCLLKSYKLSIFNRWDQLAFSTVKPQLGWNGTFNGRPSEAGSYFCYQEAVQLFEQAGTAIRKKGDLTLIRQTR